MSYVWQRERPRRRSWSYSAPEWIIRPPRPDPQQLSLFAPPDPRLSPLERARLRLRELLQVSGLTISEFATWVVGCHERTVTRYLDDGPIPEDRRNWIARLEAVELQGDVVVIRVRRGTIGPRWAALRARRRAARLASQSEASP